MDGKKCVFENEKTAIIIITEELLLFVKYNYFITINIVYKTYKI